MSKLVVLNLGKGNLQDGFPFVTARLESKGKNMQFTGSLPSVPELLNLYQRWQLLYELLYKNRSFNIRHSSLTTEDDGGIEIDQTDITHVSDVEFSDLCQQLQNQLDHWLNCEEFRQIDRQLRKELNSADEIRLIIQTEDLQVRKLPWHIWQFLQDYPQAEIALSSLNFEPSLKHKNSTNKVRILAILGDSTGINVETDRRLLEQLPDAQIVFLVEPTRRQLDEQLWDQQGWDILFFAGHSNTYVDNQTGQIYINKRESLTILQLKNALKKAIDRGLQLAIFNSCEGLGLAAELADLHIPQTIVMRESVPDIVAQEFLKYFLTGFADGESFYLAVREARERLQGIEGDFPGASWLPVICQNPAELPCTWRKLRNKIASTSPPQIALILISSIIVTTLMMGIRWLGILQTWELKAFDHLMQRLPTASADQRILIVGADEEDIRRYGYPLPDDILVQLFDKLQQGQPSSIGIDIFRDRPVPQDNLSSHQTLIAHFQKDKNLIAICAGSNLNNSIAPPPGVPQSQIGFVDLYSDKSYTKGQDDNVRRYLLSRSPNSLSAPSLCNTSYSFAWQLIYRYLKTKGIPVKTVGKNWQFGNLLLKPLEKRSGGYQNLDGRGNQLLIYHHNPPQITQQMTVRDVLQYSDGFHPDWLKNKIVLIGITAASVSDVIDTPGGKIRGLFVHANVINQILDAVENPNQGLIIWWLPQWGDTIWVFFWSFTAGIIVWRWQKLLWQTIAISISIFVLSGVCWLVFTQAGWLPFIPSILALVISSLVVAINCHEINFMAQTSSPFKRT